MFTKNAHRQPPADTMAAPSEGPVATAKRADAAPLGDDLHAPLGRVGGDEQRHRGRDEERRADALQGASGDEGGDVGGDAAQERAEQEHDDAAEEDALAAEPVTGASADDQQRAEHDGVAR